MSKQSDLVTVARDAGASGYVNVAGDTMTGQLVVTGPSGIRHNGFGVISQYFDTANYDAIRFLNNAGTTEYARLGYDLISGSGIARVEALGAASQIQFVTNNAGRMLVDSAGRVTTPYQPAACWRSTVSTSATQRMPASTVVLNNGSHLDTGGTSGRFTCPVAGMYQMMFDSYTQYNGAYNWITIRKNNAIITGTAIHWNKGGVAMHVNPSINVTISCAAGDYLEAFQDNLNANAADIIDNAFISVLLVG